MSHYPAYTKAVTHMYIRFRLFPVSIATTKGIASYFLFLGVLRCFSSPACLPHAYVFGMGWQDRVLPGFPIRRRSGLRMLAPHRSLSQAYCVLLRSHTPRHPPCALIRLATDSVSKWNSLLLSFCSTQFSRCFSCGLPGLPLWDEWLL